MRWLWLFLTFTGLPLAAQTTAPLILEGADPPLRNEYVAYSAHIDHIGISPGQRDSVNNGADDNASGVAGLLELVEAFSQPGVHPKRSLLFLAPSGEEDNFARKVMPILFFTSGTHADYHHPSDEPPAIDGEKAARLVRLLFYLGATVAEAVERPQWTPESYRQIVKHR